MADAPQPPEEAPGQGFGSGEPHPPAPRMPSEPASPDAPVFAPPQPPYDTSRPVFASPGQAQPQGMQAPAPSLWADPVGAGAPHGQGYFAQPGSAPPLVYASDGGMGFPPEDPVRPWPWWIAFVGVAMALVTIIVAGGVLTAIISATQGSDAVKDYDYLFGILQDVLWVAVAIGVPLMIVRWIRPEHLGLRGRPPAWSLALKVVIVMIGFYLLAAVYAGLRGLDDNSNQLLQDTGFGESLGKDIAYAILYPIAAPVAEELLFRGILFKGLRDGFRARVGRGPAVALGALISGAVFGSAHLGGGQDDFIPVLIALGVLLAFAYEWSGTIYVPIAIHAINNAVATASTADPTADWITGLILIAPVLAVLVAMGLARFVRRLQSEPPAAVPPSFPGQPPFGPSNGL